VEVAGPEDGNAGLVPGTRWKLRFRSSEISQESFLVRNFINSANENSLRFS